MMFEVLKNIGFIKSGDIVHDSSAKYNFRGKGIVVEILNDDDVVFGKVFLPPGFYKVIKEDMTNPTEWVRGFVEMLNSDPDHDRERNGREFVPNRLRCDLESCKRCDLFFKTDRASRKKCNLIKCTENSNFRSSDENKIELMGKIEGKLPEEECIESE